MADSIWDRATIRSVDHNARLSFKDRMAMRVKKTLVESQELETEAKLAAYAVELARDEKSYKKRIQDAKNKKG